MLRASPSPSPLHIRIASVAADGPKRTFMKKECARLVAGGLTDKKQIEEELKRLWVMHQMTSARRPLKTITKISTSKL